MFRRRISSIVASFHQTAPFSPLFAALFYSQPSWQAECFSPSQMGQIDQLTWDQYVSLIWQCVWLMLCSGLGVSACVCEKDGRHYNRSHMRFLWQRVDSLHWTMKCSNLFWLWIDGLWMSTRWGHLWYMGIPCSPWVLLWSAGISLAWLFWLAQLCLNLHIQSKSFGDAKLPFAKPVLMEF